MTSGEPDPDLSSDVIPLTFIDYLALVDWTGCILREDKKGAIPDVLPPILQRLNYPPEQWMEAMKPRSIWMQKAIGSTEKIHLYCRSIGQQWLWQTPELKVPT